MTNEYGPPSEVVAARVKEVRKKRGYRTAAGLAERCAEIGAPHLTAQMIANIENGRRDQITGRRRRDVTVDELLILAYALSVAPVHLLVPTDAEEVAPYRILPGTNPGGAWFVREWIRGKTPIGTVDARLYFSEVPEAEWQPPQWTPETIEAQSDAVRRAKAADDAR